LDYNIMLSQVLFAFPSELLRIAHFLIFVCQLTDVNDTFKLVLIYHISRRR